MVRPADDPRPPAVAFCLRGTVAERERLWLLAPGENSLGSSEANDLVLAVKGVSRRHARLQVDAVGVGLEDLASTNGSFVNGRRITRARVSAGDAVGFGPVALTLQEIDPADVELALEIPSPEEGRSGLPEDAGTPAQRERSAGRAGRLAAAERLLDRLALLPRKDPATILTALVRHLCAAGACLVEWPRRREPLVLASCGRVEDVSELAPLRSLVQEAARAAGPDVLCRSGSCGPPPLSFAVLARPGAMPLALLASGGNAEGAAAESLLRVVVRLLDLLSAERRTSQRAQDRERPPDLRFPEAFVPGVSPTMEDLYREMRPLCRGDLPVLIVGETGVGKEHVARILHASSERAAGPFVAMNCAAVPADLLEAEMFGIADGAATGVRGRRGRLEEARGGTLFLDEIGDMSLGLQAKLLRALQEKEVQPVGGRAVAVDLRIIAATNKDLPDEVERGRFRPDLYYRVAGAVLTVPPLRERREDIPPLVDRFLRDAAEAAGHAVRGLTVKALHALVAYPWPGNVRELEHEVQRLVSACPPDFAIDSTMLPARLLATPPLTEAEPGRSLRLDRHVLDLERRLIRQALERAGGSQRKAAVLLGISRNALARKRRRLGFIEEDPAPARD
jgi:DNA-binding NtrC family response regulator